MKESAFSLLARYATEAALMASDDPAEFDRQLAEGIEGTLALTDEGEVDVGRPPASTESEAAFLRDFAFEPGSALCLSGAGYRSMLFHAGALLRMNEAALLPKLVHIASVSTSSITAALLGLKWRRLEFDADGVAGELRREVLEPLLQFAGATRDNPLQTFSRRGGHLTRSLEKRLFGSASVQDLPDSPLFVINATNLRSGASWRFGKTHMGDYRVGSVPNPRVPLALAVAASAAVPMTAVRLDLRHEDFMPDSGLDLGQAPFTSQALLVDGSIRDPLGIEAAYARFRTIMVSDGGGELRPEPQGRSMMFQIARMTGILTDQVRALYKRQLVNSYVSGLREGAYWAIRSQLTDYDVETSLPYPPDRIRRLSQLPARLVALDVRDREELVNWGYAVCDAALRRHLDPGMQATGRFPYPRAAHAGAAP